MIEFLRTGNYVGTYFECMRIIFNHDTILHNYNYQISPKELKKLRSSKEEWRNNIQVGDMIDAIQEEQEAKCSCWGQARIAAINDDLLHLEFFNAAKSADRVMERYALELAEFETKSKENFEFKKELKEGDTVDCNDKTTWCKSTILKIDEQNLGTERNCKFAYIGYRVYVEKAQKSDNRGCFEGWSERFDEWVPIHSARIAQINTKSAKGNVYEEMDLEDELDSMIQPEEGQDRVYAVPRIRKCISKCMIDLTNFFG